VHGNNLINVGVSFDEQCNYLQQPHSVNIVGQGDCDHRKHHHQNVMYLLKIGLNKCFKAKIANNGLKIVQNYESKLLPQEGGLSSICFLWRNITIMNHVFNASSLVQMSNNICGTYV
jgi:hypothetical protein